MRRWGWLVLVVGCARSPLPGEGGTVGARMDLAAPAVADFATSADGSTLDAAVVDGSETGLAFAPAWRSAAVPGPTSLVLHDFDADGVLDVAAGETGKVPFERFLGLGDGHLASPVSVVSYGDSYPAFISGGDVIGDGGFEIVAAIPAWLTWSKSDGHGGFAPYGVAEEYNDKLIPTALVIADFDHTFGLGGVVLFAGQKVNLGVYLSASIFYSDPIPLRPGPAISLAGTPVAVAVGDLDGDGHNDLVVAESSPARLALLRNYGRGGFAAPKFLPVGGRLSAVALADFDGDTHLDAAVTDDATSAVWILRGDGKGGLGGAVAFPIDSHPSAILAVDLDGDGRPDLVVATTGGNRVDVLRNTGHGFASPLSLLVGRRPVALAAGDLDGDGKPDLVVADHDDNDLAVLLNRTR